jgi:hypothetical protein
LLNFYATFFALIDLSPSMTFCSHELSDFFFISLFIHLNPNIKIYKQKFHKLPTNYHLFSYIKREMRDKREKEERKKERKKEQRKKRDKKKIKIRPYQL